MNALILLVVTLAAGLAGRTVWRRAPAVREYRESDGRDLSGNGSNSERGPGL
jgi:hypothetical protein